jgi:hypothetical protein
VRRVCTFYKFLPLENSSFSDIARVDELFDHAGFFFTGKGGFWVAIEELSMKTRCLAFHTSTGDSNNRELGFQTKRLYQNGLIYSLAA